MSSTEAPLYLSPLTVKAVKIDDEATRRLCISEKDRYCAVDLFSNHSVGRCLSGKEEETTSIDLSRLVFSAWRDRQRPSMSFFLPERQQPSYAQTDTRPSLLLLCRSCLSFLCLRLRSRQMHMNLIDTQISIYRYVQIWREVEVGQSVTRETVVPVVVGLFAPPPPLSQSSSTRGSRRSRSRSIIIIIVISIFIVFVRVCLQTDSDHHHHHSSSSSLCLFRANNNNSNNRRRSLRRRERASSV